MKKTIIYPVIVVVGIAVLVLVCWWQRGDALFVQPPSDYQTRGGATLAEQLADCLPKSDMGSHDTCQRLLATIHSYDDCVAAGLSIMKSNPPQCMTPDGRTFTEGVGGTVEAMATIRNFMNDQNLQLQYVDVRKNPSNFTVGRVTEIKPEGSTVSGGWVMDTPPEWERPVYVYQQTAYIDDTCEVYEYEIDARNNQLVDVHVVYPQSVQEMTADERMAACNVQGGLYAPLKSDSAIETIATDYLKRGVANYADIQSGFVYQPSKKDPINTAAAHEWMWQDTSYQLPEGLQGDVYNYPTIRIIISSGGKLIHYFNSTRLFQSI